MRSPFCDSSNVGKPDPLHNPIANLTTAAVCLTNVAPNSLFATTPVSKGNFGPSRRRKARTACPVQHVFLGVAEALLEAAVGKEGRLRRGGGLFFLSPALFLFLPGRNEADLPRPLCETNLSNP